LGAPLVNPRRWKAACRGKQLGTASLSSADLSLDIYHVVSRAVGGEAVDVPATGRELADKYPELGIPPELIGKAILRAASMIGVDLAATDAASQANGNVPGPTAPVEAKPSATRASSSEEPVCPA